MCVYKMCSHCGGKGVVESTLNHPNYTALITVPCLMCEGTGFMLHKECFKCVHQHTCPRNPMNEEFYYFYYSG